MRLPERVSLPAQAVAILREKIMGGQWKELPSERVLADEFNVSRPTVRVALAVLCREGLVKTSQGRHSCVIIRRPRRYPGKMVVLLTSEQPYAMAESDQFVISELRRRLHESGYQLNILFDERLNRQRPKPVLEKLVIKSENACWILLKQGQAVQQWFSKGRYRAIVLGSVYADVHLPAYDTDFKAASRHAFNVFRRLGHQHIRLVIARTGLAGDQASEEGFMDGFNAASDTGIISSVIYHQRTVPSICSALDAAFRSKNPPTGLLVSQAADAVTVLTYLMRSGVRIPADVSIIARRAETILDHVVPSLARYTINLSVYARHVSHAVVRLATTGCLLPRQILTIPQFQRGDTLATRKTM